MILIWFIISICFIAVNVKLARKYHRKVSTWVIITIFIGWIATIILVVKGEVDDHSDDSFTQPDNSEGQTNTSQPEYTNTATNINSTNNEILYIEQLRGYKELLDMGAITQEEFDAKKKELLKISI